MRLVLDQSVEDVCSAQAIETALHDGQYHPIDYLASTCAICPNLTCLYTAKKARMNTGSLYGTVPHPKP